ncbi:histidinol-phosphate transaminase [Actinoplanes sp. TFC3]|uniref:pyridoxal phosphate-dependent aminotransferase n=1 Tax=Actinoplanes sp. TFC3 TaxID=1710355 RepID=UPI00137A1204|nr:histidinol-phosphate transaminase [Actinoplanes sp. TFC3]
MLRLHAGENPYGASPRALAVLAAQVTRVHRYPDRPDADLLAALAHHHRVAPERIALGNGIDEVILLLALALADEGQPTVVTAGTFLSYTESLRAARRPFVPCPLEGYRQPVDEVAKHLRDGAPLAFVCNPHNPTGGVLDAPELTVLQDAAAEGGGLLVVDEAYAEYAGPDFTSAASRAAEGSGVAVLRTFSKAYGLAGLRIGYLIADPAVTAAVECARGALPYSVNRLAQHAALAALADQRHMRETAAAVVETREQFRSELHAIGLESPPSRGNFVLVRLGPRAPRTTARLAALGCLVRDTADMGLPGHLRISIGTPAQMRRALAALARAVTAADGLRQEVG